MLRAKVKRLISAIDAIKRGGGEYGPEEIADLHEYLWGRYSSELDRILRG